MSGPNAADLWANTFTVGIDPALGDRDRTVFQTWWTSGEQEAADDKLTWAEIDGRRHRVTIIPPARR